MNLLATPMLIASLLSASMPVPPSHKPVGVVAPLGAYVGYPGTAASGSYPGFDGQLDGLTAVMQRPPTLLVLYLDQQFAPNDPSNGWPAYSSWLAGALAADPRTTNVTPVLGVPFGYNSTTGKVNLFKAFASGTYDTQVQGLLAAWRSHGYSRLYLRPSWEFNLPNNYAVTSANVSDFIAAWKHFYTVVHSYTSAHDMTVNIVWNPNVGVNQNDPSLTIAQQFPGNEYVDVIGIDTYGAPIYPGNDPLVVSTDPTQYLVTTMIAMGKTYHKPVAVCEVGGIDRTFASEFVQVMTNAHTPIAFIGLWDIDDSSGNLSWSNASDNQSTLASIWVGGLGPNGTIRNTSSP